MSAEFKPTGSSPDIRAPRSQWKLHSLGGVLRISLYLLPVSFVATFYALMGDRAIVRAPEDLAEVSFGWPFNWVTQDLSRYQPVSFPATIETNLRRAWGDPIATSYDWLMLAVDTAIIGIGVTACFYAIVFVVARVRARKRPDA